MLEQVLLGKVGVLAALADGLFVREALGALLAEPVVLRRGKGIEEEKRERKESMSARPKQRFSANGPP